MRPRSRIKGVEREDVTDALTFAQDLILAMIARERVGIADMNAQLPGEEEPAKVWPEPKTSIETRLVEEIGRLKSVEELSKMSWDELNQMWWKLQLYTQDRATEMLTGLGAKLRKQRRARDIAEARQTLAIIPELPNTPQGRLLAKRLFLAGVVKKSDKAVDLPILTDIERRGNARLMERIKETVKRMPGPRIGRSASRAAIGRAAGIAGADRDVAKEVDRIELRTRVEPGMLSSRPIDERLYRKPK